MQDKVKTYEMQMTFKEGDAGEQGVVEGQIVPYNVADGVGDVFLPGSIDTSQKDTPMLWQHDRYGLAGVWTKLTETKDGVQAVGELMLDTSIGKDVAAYLKKGIVKGISVGVSLIDWKTDEKTGGWIISKAILREASIVIWPAYEDAQVSGYKNQELSDRAKFSQTLDKILGDQEATLDTITKLR